MLAKVADAGVMPAVFSWVPPEVARIVYWIVAAPESCQACRPKTLTRATAEALGMSTTAEGIETVELATTLATLGCASGQGYYFAKPLEASAALEYWKGRRKN